MAAVTASSSTAAPLPFTAVLAAPPHWIPTLMCRGSRELLSRALLSPKTTTSRFVLLVDQGTTAALAVLSVAAQAYFSPSIAALTNEERLQLAVVDALEPEPAVDGQRVIRFSGSRGRLPRSRRTHRLLGRRQQCNAAIS